MRELDSFETNFISGGDNLGFGPIYILPTRDLFSAENVRNAGVALSLPLGLIGGGILGAYFTPAVTGVVIASLAGATIGMVVAPFAARVTMDIMSNLYSMAVNAY